MDEIPSKVPESIGVPGCGDVRWNRSYTLRIFEKLIASCRVSIMDEIPSKLPESIGVPGPGYVGGNLNCTLRI